MGFQFSGLFTSPDFGRRVTIALAQLDREASICIEFANSFTKSSGDSNTCIDIWT